jgi:hypothetical protein
MVFDIIQSHTQIGFSGSRHSIDPIAGELAAAAVSPAAEVVVGCAAGVDAFFRSRFPAARVLRVDSSLGRAGFARRSIACVEAVSSGLWVSFPGGACPSGLFPSASSGRCFSGSGSGSWASLALAIGRGGSALVYLGAVPAPGGWGLVRVPDSMGWWRFQSPQVQLSLL